MFSGDEGEGARKKGYSTLQRKRSSSVRYRVTWLKMGCEMDEIMLDPYLQDLDKNINPALTKDCVILTRSKIK